MHPAQLAGFITVGLAVGFTAGLVGIGGGVLMVPFLYFVYEGWASTLGWVIPESIEATVAHATSLFVIVPTAIVGVIAYSRANLVAWRVALPIAAASLAGGVVGARIAIMLPGNALKLFFGLFLVATSIQLATGKRGDIERPLRLSPWVTLPTGLGVGIFSALLGVGGGLVAIPLLLYVVGLDLRRVAATSLAVIVFAASAGTITYILSGWNQPGLPAGSLGYVHATAAVPLMIGAVVTVRLGAIANQRMHVRKLQWTFAVLLLILGARLVAQSLGLIA